MARGFYLAIEGPNRSGKTTQRDKLVEYWKAKYPRRKLIVTREPGALTGQSEIANIIRDIVQGATAQGFKETMNPLTEACLYAASRAQTLRTVVFPALYAGFDVISDRSVASSMAFQGGGRGFGTAFISKLNWLALNDGYDGHDLAPLNELKGEISTAIKSRLIRGKLDESLHSVTRYYLHLACHVQDRRVGCARGFTEGGRHYFRELNSGMMPDCVLYIDIRPEEMKKRALDVGDDKFDGMAEEFHGKVRDAYMEIQRQRSFPNWVTVSGETPCLGPTESKSLVHVRVVEALEPYMP